MTEINLQKTARMCLLSAATGVEERLPQTKPSPHVAAARPQVGTDHWAWGQGHILLAFGKDRSVGQKVGSQGQQEESNVPFDTLHVCEHSDCVARLRGNVYALLTSTFLWLEGHWRFKDSATYVTGRFTEEASEQDIKPALSTKHEHHKRPPFSHQEKRDPDCEYTRFKDNTVSFNKVFRILVTEKFYVKKMWLSLGILWPTETMVHKG